MKKKTVKKRVTKKIKVTDGLIGIAKTGMKFEGKIVDTLVKGVIVEEDGSFYLLQNEMSGDRPSQKYFEQYPPYSKSWDVESGSEENLILEGVTSLYAISNRKKIPIINKKGSLEINEKYSAEIYDSKIKVGCQVIKKDVIVKLYRMMTK
jgi:hypothetical protein